MTSREWILCVLGLLLCGLALRPAFIDVNDDAYPFSTYPMFASKRKAPTLVLALGVDASGSRLRLPPALLGTDEVMQANATLKRASTSRRRAQRLCSKMARRARSSPRWSTLRQIRLVKARFDPIGYFAGEPLPEREKLLTRCRVQSKGRKK